MLQGLNSCIYTSRLYIIKESLLVMESKENEDDLGDPAAMQG